LARQGCHFLAKVVQALPWSISWVGTYGTCR
jgi:hypothetical protein